MPSSISSAETNSEIESFKDLLENEEVRYVRKGYGLIFAFLMTFSYFFIFPDIFAHYYRYLPTSNLMLMYAGGSMFIHTSLIILSNLLMYFIYTMKLPFFERYRILNEPWPWEKDKQAFVEKMKGTFKTLLINNFVVLPFAFTVPVLLGTVKYDTGVFSIPGSTEIVLQIVFFMVVEDTAFYWIHRLMHTPWLYKRIHKKHHEFTTTIGIAAEYSHPLEHILCNLFPSGLGAAILGSKCHMITWYIWLIVRILETTDGHCGYEFSWSPFRLLPFSGSANYHNFHHSKNVGNYSSFFTYWDSICQTNKHYWRYLSKKEKSC